MQRLLVKHQVYGAVFWISIFFFCSVVYSFMAVFAMFCVNMCAWTYTISRHMSSHFGLRLYHLREMLLFAYVIAAHMGIFTNDRTHQPPRWQARKTTKTWWCPGYPKSGQLVDDWQLDKANNWYCGNQLVLGHCFMFAAGDVLCLLLSCDTWTCPRGCHISNSMSLLYILLVRQPQRQVPKEDLIN